MMKVVSLFLSLLLLYDIGRVQAFRTTTTTTPRVPLRVPHRLLATKEKASGTPGYPNVIIYPGKGWGLSKPKPKESLYPDSNPNDPVDTHKTARAWILNVIELAHWLSFPIGFSLFWKLFSNADALGKAVAPSRPVASVFLLMLAHMCQVFGGGISGNMMHQYEGWQVAVFRNPLEPFRDQAEPGYNDAWLRSVAYQMLFSFQTLGVLFTSLAVFGFQGPFRVLSVATGLVISLAPQLPHCTSVFPKFFQKVGLEKVWNAITCGGRPVFPLSIYLFAAFMVNTVLAMAAYRHMFLGLEWTGAFSKVPAWIMAWIPFGLIGMGGIYEGLRAETTFNQWDHLLAFIMLDAGLYLHIPYYMKLIGM